MTPIVAQAADGASAVLPFREVAIALVALLATLVSTGWLMLGIRRGYWVKRPPAMDRLGAGGGAARPGEGEVFVRSLLALWLVIGVLAMALLSFALDDTTLRSTLVGALTTSAGGAVAYYYSTKASSDARKDLIDATMAGSAQTIPELVGKTVAEARAWFAEHDGLRLKVVPEPADPDAVVTKQDPEARAKAPRGTIVTVTV